MMIRGEELDLLREIIADECATRMDKEGKVTPEEIMEWLMRHEHSAVMLGLYDLVCPVMGSRG